MLTLSRKKHQSIVIGEGKKRIEVTVVEIRNGKVQLGITAPRDTTILRNEIVDRRNKETS